jgi:diguanylate cyclase
MIRRSLDRLGLRDEHVRHGPAYKLQQRVKGITMATRPLSIDLAAAIAGDQLFLEFQPTLDWRLGRITSADALVRWKHPDLGIIPPNRFIPGAVDSGLSRDLTDCVIANAATQAARWHAEELALKIAVNISASDLADRDLPDRLERPCRKASIDPSCLTLELTESSLMGETSEKGSILARLRQAGFNLSVDDFGTGSLSSVHLEQMPFSEAKIDLTFVTRMISDPRCGQLVEILIGTAQEHGLTCVAEGVESDEALKRLLEMGCDQVQGFYISRPIAADLMPALVHEVENCFEAAEFATAQADRAVPDRLDITAHSEAPTDAAFPVAG